MYVESDLKHRLDFAETARQLAWKMSEPCEFEFAPLNRAVRDSVVQIGNNTSKSEASIQSVTALNVGETENSLTDRLKAGQQREHKDMRYFWIQEQVRDEDFSIKKEKNCANVGTKPIFASVLQQHCKLQDWYSADHRSHTPLQDDGDVPMMDLAPRLQTRRHQHRNRNRNRNTNIQLSVLIVNIETDVQAE